jgi:prevent-host-death family protein
MTIMTMMTNLLREGAMADNQWTVAQAKAKFSQLIEQAAKRGPQTITRNGRLAAVVVDAEEWQRRSQRNGSLADFFGTSPLRASGLRIPRLKGTPRQADL